MNILYIVSIDTVQLAQNRLYYIHWEGHNPLNSLNKKPLQKNMLSTETRTATAGLQEKLSFNIKLTVQEKLLLLSAIRSNIKQQLEYAETFHGEHYASTSFENVGKLTRIEQALSKTFPKQEITSDKKFDLYAWIKQGGLILPFLSILWILLP